MQLLFPIHCINIILQALDGQFIYTNCCKLRIVYSKMKDLNVKYNNDRTRDYTNPNLPTEPTSAPYPPPSRSGPLFPPHYPAHYGYSPYSPPVPYRLETPV